MTLPEALASPEGELFIKASDGGTLTMDDAASCLADNENEWAGPILEPEESNAN